MDLQNALNDEQQAQRYAQLRDKKKRTELFFTILWILTAIGDAIYLLLGLHSVGSVGLYLFSLFWIALVILQFLGLYHKNGSFIKIVPAAIAASYVCGIVGAAAEERINFALSVLPIAAVTGWGIWVQKQWDYLEAQAGFPHFRIDLNQMQQRAKSAERITKYVSVSEGVRSEASPNADGMQDLLDNSAQAAAAELSGYHDRSRHVSGVQNARQYTSGDMDEL